MNRNENLRLCLRFRYACLIDLPFTEFTKVQEFGDSGTCNFDRDIVTFYYLNFKNCDDLELFKTNVENVANNKEMRCIFILKAGSFGFEEMKNYSKHFACTNNLVLEIRSNQFYHHVSRKRLQEMLFQFVTIPPSFPCLDINDVFMITREGHDYVSGNYPVNADDPNIGLTATVKLILHQMNLLEKDNLVLIIMIQMNTDLNSSTNTLDGLKKEFDLFLDFFYSKFEYANQGLYYFLFDSRMKVPLQVSIIATDILA